MTAERAVKFVKKVSYFGKFDYLNIQSCIRKSIILMFSSSSRDKVTFLQQNSVSDVSAGIRSSGWAQARRLDTNLAKSL